jgi:hypothetical protein|tara:strand:+ start:239 stop:592 length:354 start_codon:yes stop_codon:yes gene_type:complete
MTIPTVHLKPDESFDRLGDAVKDLAALGLPVDLFDILCQRLRLLFDSLMDYVETYGELCPTARAGCFDLPARLVLPQADADLIAALGARDVEAISHLVSSSSVAEEQDGTGDMESRI